MTVEDSLRGLKQFPRFGNPCKVLSYLYWRVSYIIGGHLWRGPTVQVLLQGTIVVDPGLRVSDLVPTLPHEWHNTLYMLLVTYVQLHLGS